MAPHSIGWRVATAWAAAMFTRTRGVVRIARGILGAPDYERYRAHMRSEHPDAEPLSLNEFAMRRLESRYNKPGSRCC